MKILCRKLVESLRHVAFCPHEDVLIRMLKSADKSCLWLCCNLVRSDLLLPPPHLITYFTLENRFASQTMGTSRNCQLVHLSSTLAEVLTILKRSQAAFAILSFDHHHAMSGTISHYDRTHTKFFIFFLNILSFMLH